MKKVRPRNTHGRPTGWNPSQNRAIVVKISQARGVLSLDLNLANRAIGVEKSQDLGLRQ